MPSTPPAIAVSQADGSRLADNGLGAWLTDKAPFHCRLYSILFVTFGRLLGHNILAAEPLNLFYYFGILSCVYLLGREIFDVRAGLIAATIVALWPSLLFHSTQLIRDPLSIFCLLALLLMLTLLLRREFSWRVGPAIGFAGAVIVTTVLGGAREHVGHRHPRGGSRNRVAAWRMIRRRRFFAGNVIAIALMLIAMRCCSFAIRKHEPRGMKPPVTPFAIPSATQPAPRDGIFSRAIRQIGERRSGFRVYHAQASNIDSEVRLRSAGDVLRFVPRATVIGFFAPFPRMWVQQGSYRPGGPFAERRGNAGDVFSLSSLRVFACGATGDDLSCG